MITIIDNGQGAEHIARLVRGKKEIVKPGKIQGNASAFILSDGDMKNKKVNEKFIQSTNKPLLAIGAGYVFLGTAYGAAPKEAKIDKQGRVKIERPCPILLDLKKMFTVMNSCSTVFEDIPENFDVMASSKYPFEIIAESEKPFFGVHFNPELGADGMKIVDNFVKFVDVWNKYHKGK